MGFREDVARTFASVWPATAVDTGWLIEEFWPLLERIANRPDDPLAGELRHRLGLIMKGEAPLPDDAIAPPLVLVCRDGLVSWGIAHVADERVVRFALLLLWHPDVRGRLGECHQCGTFFLREHRRGQPGRRFCCPEHRLSFHHELHRGRTTPEARATYARAWRATNPKARLITQRRRARLMATDDGSVNLKTWQRIIAFYGGQCAYCEAAPFTDLEHVVPLSEGGSHTRGNIVPACRGCNSRRRKTRAMPRRRHEWAVWPDVLPNVVAAKRLK